MISRAEAVRRAELDHGDVMDTVWMTQNSHGRIYHDDPDCSYLSADIVVKFTRRQAQNSGYGPCKGCTLEATDMSETGSLPTDLIETVRQQMSKSNH